MCREGIWPTSYRRRRCALPRVRERPAVGSCTIQRGRFGKGTLGDMVAFRWEYDSDSVAFVVEVVMSSMGKGGRIASRTQISAACKLLSRDEGETGRP